MHELVKQGFHTLARVVTERSEVPLLLSEDLFKLASPQGMGRRVMGRMDSLLQPAPVGFLAVAFCLLHLGLESSRQPSVS